MSVSDRKAELARLDVQSLDYRCIELAIDYLREHAVTQPNFTDLSEILNLSEHHLQRLFSRWAGINPKLFLQFLSLGRTKQLRDASVDLRNAGHEDGLSGAVRLHDSFVQLEALTPLQYKSMASGLRVSYGFQPTPFGQALIGHTQRGVCYLGFRGQLSRGQMLADLAARWPGAELINDSATTECAALAIFRPLDTPQKRLSLFVSGTNFQITVWRALLRIPAGRVVTYQTLAEWIGKPKAFRAVGSAVGGNLIAWLIPCHRVLRSDGHLGGYRWGTSRKHACLALESAGFVPPCSKAKPRSSSRA